MLSGSYPFAEPMFFQAPRPLPFSKFEGLEQLARTASVTHQRTSQEKHLRDHLERSRSAAEYPMRRKEDA